MISKSKLKYINALQIKKFRKLHQEFLIQGAKSVIELLHSDYNITGLFLTEEFIATHRFIIEKKGISYEICTDKELQGAGSFDSNNAALAIATIKENKNLKVEQDEYCLVLDNIKDPGNLGTIIRIADWYGITKILCSNETADIYNPKVIASSMGSFTRVKVFYCDILEYLGDNKLNTYGAFLQGDNVHETNFEKGGAIVMGNESLGINPALEKIIKNKISIPSYGKAESLNVAIATAVICDNLMRGRLV